MSGGLVARALRRNAGPLAASAALVTVWQVAELLVPAIIGAAVDGAVATGDAVAMLAWSAVIAGHFVVLSLSYRVGARLATRALHRESHELRLEVAGHVLAPRGARTGRLPGEVLALATGDADLVAAVLRQTVFAVAGAVGLLTAATVLALIDVVLAVVVLLGVAALVAVTHVLAPRLAVRSGVRQEAAATTAGVAADLVRGLRPLKGFGGEAAALARYRTRSREAAGAAVAAARWDGLMQGATAGLSGVLLAVVALVAGRRALAGEISLGEFVAVVGISQFLAEPLRMLTFLLAQAAQSRASARRVEAFLAAPPLALGPDGAEPPAGPVAAPRLVLDGVTAGPLAGVDLAVEPGAWVGVVAEDPADAAALVALLRGETRPDAGSVLLDGRELTAVGVRELHGLLLVAEHHADLFEGTVRSAVDPWDRLDPGALADVLAATAADDVVAAVPGGLDAPTAVDGTTLSGGQRQRLALARALAADAPVLVLHDPTTAVDAVTEARVADGLRRVRHDGSGRPRTTVVVSPSPALLARADVVVHLRAGRVAARAAHASLLARADYREAVLR